MSTVQSIITDDKHESLRMQLISRVKTTGYEPTKMEVELREYIPGISIKMRIQYVTDILKAIMIGDDAAYIKSTEKVMKEVLRDRAHTRTRARIMALAETGSSAKEILVKLNGTIIWPVASPATLETKMLYIVNELAKKKKRFEALNTRKKAHLQTVRDTCRQNMTESLRRRGIRVMTPEQNAIFVREISKQRKRKSFRGRFKHDEIVNAINSALPNQEPVDEKMCVRRLVNMRISKQRNRKAKEIKERSIECESQEKNSTLLDKAVSFSTYSEEEQIAAVRRALGMSETTVSIQQTPPTPRYDSSIPTRYRTNRTL